MNLDGLSTLSQSNHSWIHVFLHIKQSQILPDTLCGFGPGCEVLVFGGNAKVYGEKTSEQNITSHLCSLMGPIR